MADNILKAIIQVEAPNVATTTRAVSSSIATIPPQVEKADESIKGLQDTLKVTGKTTQGVKQDFLTVEDVLNSFSQQGKLSISAIEQSMRELKEIIKNTSTENVEDLTKLRGAYTALQGRLNEAKGEAGLSSRLGGVSRSAKIAHSELDGMALSLRGIASGSERGFDSLGQLAFSFERLKGVSGGSKAALAALDEALLGPAGLILAATTLLPLLGEMVGGLFESGEAFKQSEVDAAAYNETLKDIIPNLDRLKEALDFSGKARLLNLQLKNLKLGIDPNSIEGLKNSLAEIPTEVAAKTEPLKVPIELGRKEINKVNEDFKDVQKQLLKLAEPIQKVVQGEFVTFQTTIGKLAEKFPISEGFKVPKEVVDKLETTEKEVVVKYQETLKTLTELDDKRTKAINERNNIQTEGDIKAQEIRNKISEKEKQLGEKADKDEKARIQKIISNAKEIQSELKALVPGDFQIINIDSLQTQLEKATKIISDFGKGFEGQQKELRLKFLPDISLEDFKLQTTKPEIQVPHVDIELISPEFHIQGSTDKLREAIQKFNEEIAQLVSQHPTVDTTLLLNLKLAIQNGDAVKAQAIKNTIDVVESIQEALVEISTEFTATVIGAFETAFAGGDVGDVFKQFTNTVGKALEALGKQMVLLSPVIQSLKLAIRTLNPALLLPAGLALIAIGKALSLSTSNLKGFAEGGEPPVNKISLGGEKGKELWVPKVLSNKISFIGEDGPQLFKPKVSGTVIPATKVNSFLKSNIVNKAISNTLISNTRINSLINKSNIVHRALGGSINSGVKFIGGEIGNEIFVPKQSNITPQQPVIGRIPSGLNVNVGIPDVRLEGSTIILSWTRTLKQQNLGL